MFPDRNKMGIGHASNKPGSDLKCRAVRGDAEIKKTLRKAYMFPTSQFVYFLGTVLGKELLSDFK